MEKLVRYALLRQIKKSTEPKMDEYVQYKRIPFITMGTEFQFLDTALLCLLGEGLVKQDTLRGCYALTDAGDKELERAHRAYSQFQEYQIFARVDLEAENAPAEGQPDHRFGDDGTHNSEFDLEASGSDLRLLIIQLLCEKEGKEFDPTLLVGLHMLISGEFDYATFWEDLAGGTVYTKIQSVVSGAFSLYELSSDRATAIEIAQNICRAGLKEFRRRQSNTRPAFVQVPARYVCANCDYTVDEYHEFCLSCGSKIAWDAEYTSGVEVCRAVEYYPVYHYEDPFADGLVLGLCVGAFIL